MGVRPQVCTVFGIDNYAGPFDIDLERQPHLTDDEVNTAIKDNDDWSLSYVKDTIFNHHTKEWRWYYDLVFIGRDSETLQGIIGWQKSAGDYDSDTFRAMSMFYPEFFESGYKEIPIITSEWQKERYWKARPATPCGGVEFQQHWWYGQGMYWMTPVWAFVTHWLLNDLGIDTDPLAYKWMLVWEWA